MGAFSRLAILGKIPMAPLTQAPLRHGHGLTVTASRWNWHKTKDLAHFYFMFGLIPLGTFVGYMNVFVGPAKLAEIPEGYAPKEYEYYENPVTRLLVKYFVKSYQQAYERTMHFLHRMAEKEMLKKTEKEVMEAMNERGDYKAYYYRPVLAKYYRFVREDAEYTKFIRGEK